MKSEVEIKKELQAAVDCLPVAKRGMPSALFREKIRCLKWVLE